MTFSGRPLVTRVAYDGPSPLDDSITDTLLGDSHSCLDCRTAYGLEQRVSLRPFAAIAAALVVVGFILGVLASSALASSPHSAPGMGSPTAAAADPDVARAVRASALSRDRGRAGSRVTYTRESAASSAVPVARARQHSIPNETAAAAREERDEVAHASHRGTVNVAAGRPSTGAVYSQQDAAPAGLRGGPSTPAATTAATAVA